MDLIPKPDQVVSAASNVAHKVLYGGLADLRPMPRTLIDEGTLREVYHYRPAAKVREQGDPVLLVTPLAAPALCFDLRRGCSLVEHLVDAGRPTYLVEYGAGLVPRPQPRHGALDRRGRPGRDPRGVRARRRAAGARRRLEPGRHLRAARPPPTDPDLPIASVTAVGSPFDVQQVPLVAPLRPLLNFTDGRGAITRLYQALGGAPQPLVRWAFQLSSFQKLVTKPLAIAHPPRRRRLPRPARGGRPVHREHDRLPRPDLRAALPPVRQGQRARRRRHRARRPRPSRVGDITAPVLVFGGATDGIAPIAVGARRSCRC